MSPKDEQRQDVRPMPAQGEGQGAQNPTGHIAEEPAATTASATPATVLAAPATPSTAATTASANAAQANGAAPGVYEGNANSAVPAPYEDPASGPDHGAGAEGAAQIGGGDGASHSAAASATPAASSTPVAPAVATTPAPPAAAAESTGNVTSLAAIREKVAARRAEELGSDPDEDDAQHGGGGGGGTNEVDSAFVLACCEQEDLGLGRLYAAMHKGRFLYIGQGREWLRWNGHHWDMDPHPERARAEVEAVSERLLDEHSKLGTAATDAEQAGDKDLAKFHRAKQKLIMKRVSRMRRQNGPGVVLEFAAGGRNAISIFGDELDNAEWLLGCANGVVDLRTGLLRGGRPEDYILKASPVRFDFDATAPRWEQFLREILSDDQDMVDYTRRLFGSCLRCGNKEHVLPVLHGKGRNGKSLLVEMVQHVLGPLGGPIPAEMLLDQNAARNADAPSPSIMGLRGMRAVFASETDEGRRFSASRCKWLSGGDTLTGRWPNDKRSVTFAPTHTLFLLTNHKPHAPADDFAFWERLHLIPFERSFVDREPKDDTEMRRDDGLKAALLKEAPGILRWLVQGCLEWQQEGLNPPAKVRAATEDYRRDEDLLALFIDDCCELVPADENDTRTRTNATELYDAFVRWFAVNISRKKQFPQRKFGALAQQKFAKRKVGGKNWYYGVILTAEARESMQGTL